jgi:hypothetical protein
MAKFQSGHSGRPAGARDARARLTKQMFEDMLAHWNEPVKPDSTRRKGPAALEVCFKQMPDAYLRLTASVLPKEFIFESVTSELDDEQIDELIAALRQRITETRTAPTLLVSSDGVGDEPAKPRH